METDDAIRRHHVALAQRLKDLRIDAGLSGHDLAQLLNSSQSRISRLETARQKPTVEEIEQFGKALKLRKSDVQELLNELTELEDEWNSFHDLQQLGANNGQARVQQAESAAKLIRQLELAVVPGLLQTPDYIRALCDIVDYFETDDDIQAVVDLRMERQEILDDTSKTFSLVLMESVLWNRYGSSDVLAEQFEHIIKVSEKKNVRVGVVPRWAPLPVIPHSAFQIFDDYLVTVATSNGELSLRHRDDIQQHIERFDRLRQVAVGGSDARQLISQFVDSLM